MQSPRKTSAGGPGPPSAGGHQAATHPPPVAQSASGPTTRGTAAPCRRIAEEGASQTHAPHQLGPAPHLTEIKRSACAPTLITTKSRSDLRIAQNDPQCAEGGSPHSDTNERINITREAIWGEASSTQARLQPNASDSESQQECATIQRKAQRSRFHQSERDSRQELCERRASLPDDCCQPLLRHGSSPASCCPG